MLVGNKKNFSRVMNLYSCMKIEDSCKFWRASDAVWLDYTRPVWLLLAFTFSPDWSGVVVVLGSYQTGLERRWRLIVTRPVWCGGSILVLPDWTDWNLVTRSFFPLDILTSGILHVISLLTSWNNSLILSILTELDFTVRE